MRKALLLAGMAMLAGACTDEKSPLAPTAIAAPSPPPVTPSLPTNVPGVLRLSLPGDPREMASIGFSVLPFGYHGAEHADDGHTGWDFAFAFAATVRAAASGTVEAVVPDSSDPSRFSVLIEHAVGTHFYRTVYTNIVVVASGIQPNAAVQVGQAIGSPGLVTRRFGDQQVSYRMTHFQLDDFEYYRNVSHPNAVSPEPFLTPDALSEFNRLWAGASYPQELVEPFISNPRDLTFPASRTWIRAGGNGPAGIRFTRRSARDEAVEYALLAESGTPIEQGQVILSTTLSGYYGGIDLVSATGRRLGAYRIDSSEMRLTLVPADAARPNDPSITDVYRTSR